MLRETAMEQGSREERHWRVDCEWQGLQLEGTVKKNTLEKYNSQNKFQSATFFV